MSGYIVLQAEAEDAGTARSTLVNAVSGLEKNSDVRVVAQTMVIGVVLRERKPPLHFAWGLVE